jgi:hypothetical protein
MQIQYKPIVSYFTGVVGATHNCPSGGTGLIIINDTAETISVNVGGLTFTIKESEVLNEDFMPFTTVDIDPTTSLGTKQVETATLAVGNVSTAGVMAVIVTAAGMSNSPKTILAPVDLTDVTPTLIMTKVRAALTADADVSALFTVSGATGAVILTRKVRAIANDTTLNIDLGGTGTTAVGITQVASSANTTPGAAPTAIGYRCWVRG